MSKTEIIDLLTALRKAVDKNRHRHGSTYFGKLTEDYEMLGRLLDAVVTETPPD